MEKEDFKAMVVEYSRAHEQLTAASAAAKELRKRTLAMQESILGHMQAHAIDECAWAGGRLVRKRTKKTEGLKKEHIEGELKKLVGDGPAAGEAVTNMYNRRATDFKETLSLLKTAADNSTA